MHSDQFQQVADILRETSKNLQRLRRADSNARAAIELLEDLDDCVDCVCPRRRSKLCKCQRADYLRALALLRESLLP